MGGKRLKASLNKELRVLNAKYKLHAKYLILKDNSKMQILWLGK